MSVGSADVCKAINAAWDAQSMDDHFTDLWASSVTSSDWEVLHDAEASDDQPFPYVVFEIGVPNTIERMSGNDENDVLMEVRDVPLSFSVYARKISGDGRTAKQIAGDLAEEIMKTFGGHPSESPSALTLDNGTALLVEHQTDYGVRQGEDEWQWVVDYVVRVDVPVAV